MPGAVHIYQHNSHRTQCLQYIICMTYVKVHLLLTIITISATTESKLSEQGCYRTLPVAQLSEETIGKKPYTTDTLHHDMLMVKGTRWIAT